MKCWLLYLLLVIVFEDCGLGVVAADYFHYINLPYDHTEDHK